jgi:RNA polymerase sigma-70 factor (ECF subfamily)
MAMNELEMINASLAGDGSAFTGLVESYQSGVFNLCYRMLGERCEAEDAVQEAFLRAYSQLHRYDPTRSFKTWLFSIAAHYCIDRLRRRRIIWVGLDDEPIQYHPALRESSRGPLEMAERHERGASVQALLQELSPQDRAAVVMRYWYDLSYEEIAEVTGVTVSSVKSRLHRARVALGEMMSSTDLGPRRPTREPRPARPAARVSMGMHSSVAMA